MKILSLLGSTGSIGTQTIEIVRRYPSEFRVAGLTTNAKIDVLQHQIELLKPEAVAVMDEAKAEELERKATVAVYKGMEGIRKIARLEQADTGGNALVGSIGIEPTYDAVMHGKNIALANKETLVAAGSVIVEAIGKKGISFMPIDSEHSAIFQCLKGERMKELKSITITCSGGPFRELSPREMAGVTITDALKHPTWKMGAKITVDSSTWMNKGFEVIEAHWLFGIPYERINVVVHPQSIVHSLVEFSDSSVIAQLGWPDMTIPIQYALTHPQRLPTSARPLDMAEAQKLEFLAPDTERFPCLAYAYGAGKAGGIVPAAMNAANEVAVQAFIKGEIGYLDIPEIIRRMMDAAPTHSHPSLQTILDIDKGTEEKAQLLVENDFRRQA